MSRFTFRFAQFNLQFIKRLTLRFHHLHGRNARISNGGLTASRPNALSEFNDAIGKRALLKEKQLILSIIEF